MARRRPTAAQLREHRSKQLAIVLGLVFVVVAAVQVPRLMKQLSPPKLAENAGTGLVAAPSSTAASGDAAAAASTQLNDFSRLPLKDPFRPLVKAASTPSSPPAATTPAVSPPKLKLTPPITPTKPTPFISPPPNPPNAALIELNGQREIVAIGAGFPQAQPLFKLVGLEKKSVQIGVFAGSFSSGTSTLAIKQGHKITLVNQFDETHYVVKLVGLTVAPAANTQPAGTTTTEPTVTTAISP
jgi:hypothetical protein